MGTVEFYRVKTTVAGTSGKYEVPSIDTPQGFNIDNAAAIRKGTGIRGTKYLRRPVAPYR